MCSERLDKRDNEILYMMTVEQLADVWLDHSAIAILGAIGKAVGQIVLHTLDAIHEHYVFAHDGRRVELEAKEGIVQVFLPSATIFSMSRESVKRATYAWWWLIAATH